MRSTLGELIVEVPMDLVLTIQGFGRLIDRLAPIHSAVEIISLIQKHDKVRNMNSYFDQCKSILSQSRE